MAAARFFRASLYGRTSAYEKFEKIFTKLLARSSPSLLFASPPRRLHRNGNNGSKNSSLQVLTDRKDDVEWAAHPGRNVSGRFEERIASD